MDVFFLKNDIYTGNEKKQWQTKSKTSSNSGTFAWCQTNYDLVKTLTLRMVLGWLVYKNKLFWSEVA